VRWLGFLPDEDLRHLHSSALALVLPVAFHAVGLGGKAFVVMSGTLADVEASVAAGVAAVPKPEHVVRSVVIPNPHKDLNRFML
jgi:microcompartment protein CcmL/EutN